MAEVRPELMQRITTPELAQRYIDGKIEEIRAQVGDKKVLLVDDVFTTGSTVRACLNLLKKEKPRKLAVLTMSKTDSSA